MPETLSTSRPRTTSCMNLVLTASDAEEKAVVRMVAVAGRLGTYQTKLTLLEAPEGVAAVAKAMRTYRTEPLVFVQALNCFEREGLGLKTMPGGNFI